MVNYFTQKDEAFHTWEEIKQMVTFSRYDLLDKKSYTLPESVFGEFDMLFCRNVLIYFKLEYQKIIIEKLYKSLKTGGYLILGEAEAPVEGFKNKFSAENRQFRIYQKQKVGWQGDYVARIDPEQIKILNKVSSPEFIPFHISRSVAGDIVSGLDFTLSNNEE